MKCSISFSILQYLTIHLKFLQFVLQEGDLYLPVNRAKELLSALVTNPEACEWDREVNELCEWSITRLVKLKPFRNIFPFHSNVKTSTWCLHWGRKLQSKQQPALSSGRFAGSKSQDVGR